jgi:hypothetical protein
MGKRALVLFAVAISLGACGSDSSKNEKADTVNTSKRTTTTVAAAAVALEARLIKNVPAGYKQEEDSVGDTGPSDLAKAIRDEGSDDARQALTSAGFVAGYQRLWTSGDNELINFLYQFATPQGATDYMARTVAGADEGGGEVTVTPFSVTGVPGAKGFQYASPEGNAVIVVFVRGTYLAQININGTDASQANVTTLATQQYNNLA